MRPALAMALMAALSAAESGAKCAMPLVQVSGRILEQSGTPRADAIVAVAWEERNSIGGPLVAISDANGGFRVSFQFNTHTRRGLLFGEKCAERLERVRISAQAGDERAEPRWVSL